MDVVEAVVPKRERGGQAARARAHDRDAQRRGTRAPERCVLRGIGLGIVRPSRTRRRDGRPETERARSARTPVGTSFREAGPDRTRRGHRAEPGVRRVPGADAASGRGARRRSEIRRRGHRARRSGVWGGGELRASVSAFGKVGYDVAECVGFNPLLMSAKTEPHHCYPSESSHDGAGPRGGAARQWVHPHPAV